MAVLAGVGAVLFTVVEVVGVAVTGGAGAAVMFCRCCEGASWNIGISSSSSSLLTVLLASTTLCFALLAATPPPPLLLLSVIIGCGGGAAATPPKDCCPSVEKLAALRSGSAVPERCCGSDADEPPSSALTTLSFVVGIVGCC